MEQNDTVNHPSHYTDGKIEVIDYIEDKKLGFHLGNAVKYISRAGKKDPEKTVEDLQKAMWYIQRYIGMTMGYESTKAADPEAELRKENAELKNKLSQFIQEFNDLSVQYAELKAAYQIAQNPAPPAPIRDALADAIEEDLADQDPDRKDPTASAALYGGDGLSHVKEPKPVVVQKKKKQLEDAEAAYQKRAITDIGKLRSLRAAGWSLAKIADEFGCTPATVSNTLKREGIA